MSLTDTNLSSLLTGNTLVPGAGDGELQNHVTVLPASESLLQKPDVLTVKFSVPESYDIDAGQQVILHGMKIGQVISRELNEKASLFIAAIEPSYRNLVHGDSKFIVNSRLDVKVLSAIARE